MPAVPVSMENSAILTNSERWPLMISSQLQGIKWIRKKNDNGLTLLRMNNYKLINIIGECIEDGKTVFLENLNEMIDAQLSPIIDKKNSINSITINIKCIKISDLLCNFTAIWQFNFQLL